MGFRWLWRSPRYELALSPATIVRHVLVFPRFRLFLSQSLHNLRQVFLSVKCLIRRLRANAVRIVLGAIVQF